MSARKSIRYVLGAALLVAGGVALAAGPAAVRRQIEATMLVTGKIQIDGEGKVTGFAFDQKEQLPTGVVGMLDKAVPTWKFEPVQVAGRPVNVSTDMSVRLVAKKLDDNNYSLAIRGASFGGHAEHKHKVLKPEQKSAPAVAGMCAANMQPPRYPEIAARNGVASNVYLLLKLDREGSVLDVMAEQVNLKVVSDENSMARWRRMFMEVSVAQARKWCIPPSNEDLADADTYRVVRVPVLFHLDPLPRYGQWEAYVPGPRMDDPWSEDDSEGVAFSPDTLLPGRAYLAGSGLKLLTDPTGG